MSIEYVSYKAKSTFTHQSIFFYNYFPLDELKIMYQKSEIICQVLDDQLITFKIVKFWTPLSVKTVSWGVLDVSLPILKASSGMSMSLIDPIVQQTDVNISLGSGWPQVKNQPM